MDLPCKYYCRSLWTGRFDSRSGAIGIGRSQLAIPNRAYALHTRHPVGTLHYEQDYSHDLTPIKIQIRNIYTRGLEGFTQLMAAGSSFDDQSFGLNCRASRVFVSGSRRATSVPCGGSALLASCGRELFQDSVGSRSGRRHTLPLVVSFRTIRRSTLSLGGQVGPTGQLLTGSLYLLPLMLFSLAYFVPCLFNINVVTWL